MTITRDDLIEYSRTFGAAVEAHVRERVPESVSHLSDLEGLDIVGIARLETQKPQPPLPAFTSRTVPEDTFDEVQLRALLAA